MEGVRKFWDTAIPSPKPSEMLRTFTQWNFLVHAEGFEGIDCSLEGGQTITWRSWSIQVIATPGHSSDHVVFAAKRTGATSSAGGPLVLFAGDALSGPGKMWSSYMTDWDHWTDQGLQKALDSLYRLASLDAAILFPEHGPPITRNTKEALAATANAAAEVAFLKSFERYNERLGDPPAYALLNEKGLTTIPGDKPWAQLSTHLFVTRNTYALVSKDGPVLIVDAYDNAGRSIDEKFRQLQAAHRLGPVEVVMASHAHYDHYSGIFSLSNRDAFQVWTLEQVARPISDPHLLCAPFLDARPVKVDRRLRDGEEVTWREYRFRIHHLPAQTEFHMGVEVTIDGRKCFFTGDNFYHVKQYSGSGGWSGRNRGWPLDYASSAAEVLEARPDWVLAEHGGAFVFNQEDFKRRVSWGNDAAAATDALSPSGSYRRDWNPHRIHVEPLLQQAQPGQTLRGVLEIANSSTRAEKLSIRLDGRGLISDIDEGSVTIGPGMTAHRNITFSVANDAPPGRHVFPLVVEEGRMEDGADSFLMIDVKK